MALGGQADKVGQGFATHTVQEEKGNEMHEWVEVNTDALSVIKHLVNPKKSKRKNSRKTPARNKKPEDVLNIVYVPKVSALF